MSHQGQEGMTEWLRLYTTLADGLSLFPAPGTDGSLPATTQAPGTPHPLLASLDTCIHLYILTYRHSRAYGLK